MTKGRVCPEQAHQAFQHPRLPNPSRVRIQCQGSAKGTQEDQIYILTQWQCKDFKCCHLKTDFMVYNGMMGWQGRALLCSDPT